MEIEDIATQFFKQIENTNESVERFKNSNIPKAAISELLYVDTYCEPHNTTISSFRNLYNGVEFNLADSVLEDVLIYLRGINRTKSDAIKILAELHISQYRINPNVDLPPLVNPKMINSSYVDLASGPDFINYFTQFDKEIHYYSIDSSYFVHECLTQYASKTNSFNFTSINFDLEEVKKPHGSHIMAVRSKNIGGYVGIKNGFNFIQKTAKWLEIGGIFIFHEYATSLTFEEFCKNSKIIADNIGCIIEELVSGNSNKTFSVHTAILIRSIDV